MDEPKLSTRSDKFKHIIITNSYRAENSELIFEDAIQQWQLHTGKTEYSETCICSAPIQHNYAIINCHNKNVLIVGSECINKFSCNELKKALKLKLKMEKGNKKHKLCCVCCTYCIPITEPTKTICSSCWNDDCKTPSSVYLELYGETCDKCQNKYVPRYPGCKTCTDCYNEVMRFATPCKRCGENNIPPGQEKKEMCSKCSQSEECRRVCSNCNKKAILGNAPEWVKTCSDCDAKLSKKCENCDENFKPRFPGCKICTTCYKTNMEYARTCSKCGNNTIPPNADVDVTVCNKCKKPEGMRQCEVCKNLTIYPKAPPHVTKCYKCLEIEMRSCEKCNQKKIYPNAPAYVKLCTTCQKVGKPASIDTKCKNPECNTILTEKWMKLCGPCYANVKRS